MSRTGSAAKRSNKCKRDDSGPLHLLVQTIKHEEFQIQTPVISSHVRKQLASTFRSSHSSFGVALLLVLLHLSHLYLNSLRVSGSPGCLGTVLGYIRQSY